MSGFDPERISAWLDGELDEAERAEVEAAVEASPELRRAAEEQREAKRALGRLPPVEPRPELEFELRHRLREDSRPSRLRFWATLAAGLLIGGLWLRGTPEFVVLELAHDHRKCFSKSSLPAKVWGSDLATVRGWFAERGTLLPLLPERVGDVGLVGARYCPLPGVSFAPHLYFAGDDVQVSIFVVPRDVRFEDGYGAINGDVAVRLFRSGGAVIAVASENTGAVEHFRHAIAGLGRSARGTPETLGLTPRGATATIFIPPHRGAVAQLGARVNGIHEVMGSIPISSTNSSNNSAK